MIVADPNFPIRCAKIFKTELKLFARTIAVYLDIGFSFPVTHADGRNERTVKAFRANPKKPAFKVIFSLYAVKINHTVSFAKSRKIKTPRRQKTSACFTNGGFCFSIGLSQTEILYRNIVIIGIYARADSRELHRVFYVIRRGDVILAVYDLMQLKRPRRHGFAATIHHLNLTKNSAITLRLEIPDTAKNVGGITLFGKKFGDYETGIRLLCSNDTK